MTPRSTTPRPVAVLADAGVAVRALVDLVLPAGCAICGAGPPPLCRTCRRALRPGGPPHRSTPQPAPVGFPVTWVAGPLTAPLTAALTAYKDRDRRDLAPVLADLLSGPLRSAVGATRGVTWVIPVPGSDRAARRRGDRPLEVLATGAAEFTPGSVRVVRALRATRAVRDQSRLDHAQRQANLAGALAVVPGALDGVRAGDVVVVVDDIVTSGATLAEAARAVRAVGHDCVAACIAATGRRAARYPVGGADCGPRGGRVVGPAEAG